MTASRGASRRSDIVAAAATQFAESGYPAVGMDQIGAAAGITGPAIYRHFDSKAAVLAAVFDSIIDAVAPEAVASLPQQPAEQLRRLIDGYARAVASRRKLMSVFVREVHHLPAAQRSGLEIRQRALVRSWRTLLAAVHPGWSVEQVRIAVHATFGMLNSVGTFSSPLTDHRLGAELSALARRTLQLDPQA